MLHTSYSPSIFHGLQICNISSLLALHKHQTKLRPISRPINIQVVQHPVAYLLCHYVNPPTTSTGSTLLFYLDDYMLRFLCFDNLAAGLLIPRLPPTQNPCQHVELSSSSRHLCRLLHIPRTYIIVFSHASDDLTSHRLSISLLSCRATFSTCLAGFPPASGHLNMRGRRRLCNRNENC